MKIRNLMTPSPHTINATQTLEFAQEKMRELGVRHLPVLQGGQLMGVLSERDIQFVESFDSLKPDEIQVEEAYSSDVYAVQADTKLADVCAEMAERKLGSALIEEDKKLVGIFTWIDALQYLAKSS